MKSERNFHGNVLITERRAALTLGVREAVQGGQGGLSECRTPVRQDLLKLLLGQENLTQRAHHSLQQVRCDIFTTLNKMLRLFFMEKV